MTAEPDDVLSPEEIAATLRDAGIALTAGNLQAMIEAARSAKTEAPRAVEMFPMKALLPLHVHYEVGRRACASGALVGTKVGNDWFVTEAAVKQWLTTSGRWFADEGAVQKWHAGIAGLKRWWKP